MSTAYVTVTIAVAAIMGYAATVDFVQVETIHGSLSRLGVPLSWRPTLGWLKAAGALGLLVGLAVPAIGVAAAVGLVLFFVGAIVAVVRARWYEHWYPVLFLLFAAGALALRVATL